MTDEEKARIEQERVRRIWEQIGVVDQKIQECNQVKETLVSYQGSLDGAIESWESVNKTLHSDMRYTWIVTTDIFEGEMANQLKSYMANVVADIATGIADTKTLLQELTTQIGALEKYANQLKVERNYLMGQL